ncbi:hypothetical protein ACLX1H_011168 [Fusarium chlamydosporum]
MSSNAQVYYGFRNAEGRTFPFKKEDITRFPALKLDVDTSYVRHFGMMTNLQAHAVLKWFESGRYAEGFPIDPDFPNPNPIDHNSDTLVHHLKVYEFAGHYGIAELARLALEQVMTAGDKLKFVDLLRALIHNGFYFTGTTTPFLNYVVDHASLINEDVTREDITDVQQTLTYNRTFENIILVNLLEKEFENQQLRDALYPDPSIIFD